MKEIANAELRRYMYNNRVSQWKVAQVIGVHENTVIRWLRTPLTPKRHQKITQAVEQILREREG